MILNRLTVQETLQDLSVFFYEDQECSRLETEAAKATNECTIFTLESETVSRIFQHAST